MSPITNYQTDRIQFFIFLFFLLCHTGVVQGKKFYYQNATNPSKFRWLINLLNLCIFCLLLLLLHFFEGFWSRFASSNFLFAARGVAIWWLLCFQGVSKWRWGTVAIVAEEPEKFSHFISKIKLLSFCPQFFVSNLNRFYLAWKVSWWKCIPVQWNCNFGFEMNFNLAWKSVITPKFFKNQHLLYIF